MKRPRILLGARWPLGLCLLGNLTGAPVEAVTARNADASAESRPVRGSRSQLREAWLASDAAVVCAYLGTDSTLGPRYHRAMVQDVWLGTPVRGPFVFKAPRGIRAETGGTVLLFLWDRLAGAFDAYLDESRRRHGEHVWEEIGPDSITAYVLPFLSYAYAFEKDELRLRGTSAFPIKIPRQALRDELGKFEAELQPVKLFRNADLCVRARVAGVQVDPRLQDDVVVERKVRARFEILEAYGGTPPDSLHLEYVSFPRAPRFTQGEEVLLFLAREADRFYFRHGKRSVLHLQQGEVLETGQPLSEFIEALRNATSP